MTLPSRNAKNHDGFFDRELCASRFFFYTVTMDTDEKKKRFSSRTKWTVVVLLAFILLGVVSGLVDKRFEGDYSYDRVDEAAQGIFEKN